MTHNTPYRAGKGYVYEGGLRVPLIVRGPGIPAGRVVDAPFINTDWVPTILDLAGLPAARDLDGLDQAQLLRTGTPPRESRTFFWHIPHYTNQGSRPAGAVREGRWKLVEHYDSDRDELFDLDADPGETNDLSADQPARTVAMRARLRQWRSQVGAQENTPNPSLNPELYRQLYVEFDPTRFDPLRADDTAWNAVRVWRQRMDSAIRQPSR